MKQNFFKITASNRFQAVVQFLRKELGWRPSDPLVSPSTQLDPILDLCSTQFTYINLSFAPALDDSVANLYKVRLNDLLNGIITHTSLSALRLMGI
jgi:ubiquitin-like protein ATG12